MRDSTVRWARFTPAPASAGPAEPRRTNPIVERIASLSPAAALDGPAAVAPGQPPTLSINVKVAALIAEATCATHLGRMPPGWQAWL
jgi:hypothetical protein